MAPGFEVPRVVTQLTDADDRAGRARSRASGARRGACRRAGAWTLTAMRLGPDAVPVASMGSEMPPVWRMMPALFTSTSMRPRQRGASPEAHRRRRVSPKSAPRSMRAVRGRRRRRPPRPRRGRRRSARSPSRLRPTIAARDGRADALGGAGDDDASCPAGRSWLLPRDEGLAAERGDARGRRVRGARTRRPAPAPRARPSAGPRASPRASATMSACPVRRMVSAWIGSVIWPTAIVGMPACARIASAKAT